MTRPFGAVLAGGAGRRLGGRKALVEIRGIPLALRAARTLSEVAEPIVLVSDDEEAAAALELDRVGDLSPRAGPLGGVEAALVAAESAERRGVLVLACDMPLLPAAVLCLLLAEEDRAPIVLPASPGPLGVEPLCGYYSVEVLGAVREALASGRRAMHAFLDRVRLYRLPESRFADLGPPERLFHNVNTPEDRDRAEELLVPSRNDDARGE